MICNTCNQPKTTTTCSNPGCSSEWIDNHLLQFNFGISDCEGTDRPRFIPSFLFNHVYKEETKIPDPCNKNYFFRLKQGNWYHWDKSKGINDLGTWIAPATIPNDLIGDVDGAKISNVPNLFKKSNRHPAVVDDSGKQYNIANGQNTLKPNYELFETVFGVDNKLKAVFDKSSARKSLSAFLTKMVNMGNYTAAQKTELLQDISLF
jgi:hypothetical protein